MTQTELYDALKTLGMPVTYSHFREPPKPPYINYLFSYSGDLMADNQNYLPISNYQIELYAKQKDPVSEQKLQGLFSSLRLPYSKFETYIESEKIRQVVYTIQIIEE